MACGARRRLLPRAGSEQDGIGRARWDTWLAHRLARCATRWAEWLMPELDGPPHGARTTTNPETTMTTGVSHCHNWPGWRRGGAAADPARGGTRRSKASSRSTTPPCPTGSSSTRASAGTRSRPSWPRHSHERAVVAAPDADAGGGVRARAGTRTAPDLELREWALAQTARSVNGPLWDRLEQLGVVSARPG